jgi:hypothetical protein
METKTITGKGMGPMKPLPINLNQLGNPIIGNPPDVKNATPRSIDIIARVTIKDGTPNLVIIVATPVPIKNPAARVIAIAMETAITLSTPDAIIVVNIIAFITLENPTVDPTDKSISPEMITIVIPIAIIPLNEALRRILKKLLPVKKFGATNAK